MSDDQDARGERDARDERDARGERDARAGDREVERWFRGVGLPSFVGSSRRGDRLLARVVPFVVFTTCLAAIAQVVAGADLTVDVDSVVLILILAGFLVVAAIAIIALPIVVGVLADRALRARPRAVLPVGIVAFGLYLVVLPVVAGLRLTPAAGALYAAAHVGVVLFALAATWLGLGSLLAWAARAAFGQLSAVGALVTRALPILMLVIVFAFFSRPVWEVTSTMSPARLFAVALFFVVLGVLFVVPISRTEMRELDEGIEPADRIRLARSTGLGELDAFASEPGPPLDPRERRNLQAVLVLALGLQTVLFALIVCVFLVVLGGLALSPEVLEEWVGGRLRMVELFGFEVPFTWALVKTSIFLSCVSSLNFLVSVTTNSAYRAAFFHPLIAEARTALVVRAASLRRRSGAPADDPEFVEETLARASATPKPTVAAERHDPEMIEPFPGTAG